MGVEEFKQDTHTTVMETGRASGVGQKKVEFKSVMVEVEGDYTGNKWDMILFRYKITPKDLPQ
eukprot:12834481-Ditylum_brightwellii.AAC.1